MNYYDVLNKSRCLENSFDFNENVSDVQKKTDIYANEFDNEKEVIPDSFESKLTAIKHERDCAVNEKLKAVSKANLLQGVLQRRETKYKNELSLKDRELKQKDDQIASLKAQIERLQQAARQKNSENIISVKKCRKNSDQKIEKQSLRNRSIKKSCIIILEEADLQKAQKESLEARKLEDAAIRLLALKSVKSNRISTVVRLANQRIRVDSPDMVNRVMRFLNTEELRAFFEELAVTDLTKISQARKDDLSQVWENQIARLPNAKMDEYYQDMEREASFLPD